MTASKISPEPSVRSAVVLMTMTSFMVPFGGIIISPILAHGLGVAGRGEVAAAIAPNSLLVAVATIGLPEALTYYLAKHPQISRSALALATGCGLAFGIVCFLAVLVALPFLSSGDHGLGQLILIGTALAVPQLVVNLLRGAASGRQMWRTVATERVVNSLLRIVAFVTLILTSQLTVLTAVLTTCLGPVVAGIAYWRLVGTQPIEIGQPFEGRLGRVLLAFGTRVWLGAVASMLLARISQILFAPLSDVTQLGLYAVAITISDVPLIVAIAIRDAVYGISSKSGDANQVTTASRLTLLLGVLGSLMLGVTLPVWIGIVFGQSFVAAVVPTWILMLASVINIPGFLAAAGLGAWGRPGLRSLGLAMTLLVNIGIFVVLVPSYGAVGGAIASLCSAIASTTYMVSAAARVLHARPSTFLVPTRADLTRLWVEGKAMLRRLKLRRHERARASRRR